VPARLAPLRAEQFAEAAALLGAGDRPRELLQRAALGTTEATALAAYDDDDALAGVAILGELAGAVGTGALLWVAVRPDARRHGIGRSLVDRSVALLQDRGARLVVAEVAGAASSVAVLHLLAACGFRSEGEVPDFYRDGVPLLLLGRRLEQ
jgi:ribosomal protein S18 acetylase RimI-like enzyme